jgi:hypothetical protein
MRFCIFFATDNIVYNLDFSLEINETWDGNLSIGNSEKFKSYSTEVQQVVGFVDLKISFQVERRNLALKQSPMLMVHTWCWYFDDTSQM